MHAKNAAAASPLHEVDGRREQSGLPRIQPGAILELIPAVNLFETPPMAEGSRRPPFASLPHPLASVPLSMCSIEEYRQRYPHSAVVDRVRAEFREMAGFSLTCEQAARLFGLPASLCGQVLAQLTEQGFRAKAATAGFV